MNGMQNCDLSSTIAAILVPNSATIRDEGLLHYAGTPFLVIDSRTLLLL